jgi:hypothetical protein
LANNLESPKDPEVQTQLYIHQALVLARVLVPARVLVLALVLVLARGLAPGSVQHTRQIQR